MKKVAMFFGVAAAVGLIAAYGCTKAEKTAEPEAVVEEVEEVQVEKAAPAPTEEKAEETAQEEKTGN